MELKELNGAGWTKVDPPMEDDGDNVIARVHGTPINGGVKMGVVEELDMGFHEQYSTGPYRIELRVTLDSSHVKVVRSDAY